jgi:glycosyltransferase involved in cell wall biosynthesis
MNIALITPGSGDSFYCENCIRDNVLAKSLIKLGHKVTVIPMYLPRIIDKTPQARTTPIFFGGINTYLQQKYAFFRNTPRWIDALFDSEWLLRMVARRAGSVRANGLGEMTLSMLRGSNGNQVKELERLMSWLSNNERPDIIHIATPLLLGLASDIKERLKAPIVCSLQDEDVWIDSMEAPYSTKCWEAMAEQSKDVDAFVAVSQHFADAVKDRIKLNHSQLHVVHIGIELDGHEPAPRTLEPPVIGYLARMSTPLGLGTLVDTFIALKQKAKHKNLRLHITGGSTNDDKPLMKRLLATLAAKNLQGDVTFVPDFDRASRLEFLQSLSVLSVPASSGTAFGTYILEALASGVPVVEPRIGSYPELVNSTNGGILYDPNDPEALATALESILGDRKKLLELGNAGRKAVIEGFGMETMARNMLSIYDKILS